MDELNLPLRKSMGVNQSVCFCSLFHGHCFNCNLRHILLQPLPIADSLAFATFQNTLQAKKKDSRDHYCRVICLWSQFYKTPVLQSVWDSDDIKWLQRPLFLCETLEHHFKFHDLAHANPRHSVYGDTLRVCNWTRCLVNCCFGDNAQFGDGDIPNCQVLPNEEIREVVWETESCRRRWIIIITYLRWN